MAREPKVDFEPKDIINLNKLAAGINEEVKLAPGSALPTLPKGKVAKTVLDQAVKEVKDFVCEDMTTEERDMLSEPTLAAMDKFLTKLGLKDKFAEAVTVGKGETLADDEPSGAVPIEEATPEQVASTVPEGEPVPEVKKKGGRKKGESLPPKKADTYPREYSIVDALAAVGSAGMTIGDWAVAADALYCEKNEKGEKGSNLNQSKKLVDRFIKYMRQASAATFKEADGKFILLVK